MVKFPCASELKVVCHSTEQSSIRVVMHPFASITLWMLSNVYAVWSIH
jgi:hypothetical protein